MDEESRPDPDVWKPQEHHSCNDGMPCSRLDRDIVRSWSLSARCGTGETMLPVTDEGDA